MSLPLPNMAALGLAGEGVSGSWAVFSQDRAYRYMLARTWDSGYGVVRTSLFAELVRPLMLYVMLNPSTADATKADPTIRRCVALAKRERCGGILVVNLCARISTDPRVLLRVDDPIGPHNRRVVHHALSGPVKTVIVAAWGRADRRIVKLAAPILDEVRAAGRLRCFGTTKGGDPRHPLMLRADTPLVEFEGET